MYAAWSEPVVFAWPTLATTPVAVVTRRATPLLKIAEWHLQAEDALPASTRIAGYGRRTP
jgi:hypothetical protein